MLLVVRVLLASVAPARALVGVVSLGPYPGYDGGMAVAGTVGVTAFGGGLRFAGTVAGLERYASGGWAVRGGCPCCRGSWRQPATMPLVSSPRSST